MDLWRTQGRHSDDYSSHLGVFMATPMFYKPKKQTKATLAHMSGAFVLQSDSHRLPRIGQ